MSKATATATEEQGQQAGLIARSSAVLSIAWDMRAYIPTVLTAALSYYIFGPSQASWSLRLTLFTALARYQSTSSRSSSPTDAPLSPEKIVEISQTTRKKRAHMLGDDGPGKARVPKDGAVWEYEIEVKRRGLKGVLEEADKEENGHRKFRAEWNLHSSLLPSASSTSGSTSLSNKTDRVLLYTHGGAYTTLSPRTHRPITIALSRELGVRALSLDYGLSPETRFPGALLEAINGYFYLTEDLGIPASSIIVGGDSAGGNLVFSLMLYLRDNGLPQVGGGVLISPWFDFTASLASWDENVDLDYVSLGNNSPLSPQRLFLPTDRYDTLVASPYVSPALSASLDSLPPLLIHSSGAENLRDEHTLLALRAAKAGNQVTHEVFQEGVHVAVFVQPDTIGKVAFRAAGEWGKTLGPVEAKLPGGGKLAEVDAKLQKAWDAHPDLEKKDLSSSSSASTEAEKPALFTYEKSFSRLPPIKLREAAHEKAREAVKEVEGYEAEEGVTAVWTPRPAPKEGLVERVRGLFGV